MNPRSSGHIRRDDCVPVSRVGSGSYRCFSYCSHEGGEGHEQGMGVYCAYKQRVKSTVMTQSEDREKIPTLDDVIRAAGKRPPEASTHSRLFNYESHTLLLSLKPPS